MLSTHTKSMIPNWVCAYPKLGPQLGPCIPKTGSSQPASQSASQPASSVQPASQASQPVLDRILAMSGDEPDTRPEVVAILPSLPSPHSVLLWYNLIPNEHLLSKQSDGNSQHRAGSHIRPRDRRATGEL